MQLTSIDVLESGSGHDVAVSPDGACIAAVIPGALWLWRESESVQQIALAGLGDATIAFSSDSALVRVGTWRIDVATGSADPLFVDQGLMISGIAHADRADARQYRHRSAATSSDGSRTVIAYVFTPTRRVGDSGHYDGPTGQVVLLDVDSQRLVAVLEADVGWQNARCLDIDNEHVVVAGPSLMVFDAFDGSVLAVDDEVESVCSRSRLDPAGRVVAAARVDGSVELRSIPQLRTIAQWSAHEDRVRALAFHPSRPLLATGGDDGIVKVWDTDGREPQLAALHAMDDSPRGLAFSTHGDRLLVATDEEVVVLELS